MDIRKIEINEYDKLVRFYSEIIEEMPKFGVAVGWIMGVYPTYQFLKEQVEEGNCYAAIDGDSFAGAMIVNTLYNEGYEKAEWLVDAQPSEFAGIHLLGVLPKYHHHGIASALTYKAVEVAKAMGLKTVRLDVIDGNDPARRLYTKCGFKYIQDIDLYYDDCGLMKFYLYEYPLQNL